MKHANKVPIFKDICLDTFFPVRCCLLDVSIVVVFTFTVVWVYSFASVGQGEENGVEL